jgi:dienelactone hydrolase
MLHHRLIAALALLLTAAMPADADDVAATYDRAVVYVPGARTPVTPAEVKTSRRYPAVVFLHGCAGIGTRDQEAHRWGAHIASQGYVAVIPDSLARSRPASCDRKARTASMFPGVFDLRRAEARHAAERVRAAPWFDGRALVLMGYSEGAIAALSSNLDGFTAVIATAWTCNIRFVYWLDGISVAPQTPLLTIAFERDRWFQSWIFSGSCADRFDGRQDARHVALPGQGHGTARSQVARKAVADFLARFL